MSLSEILRCLFGSSAPPPPPDIEQARENWRAEVHANRTEIAKSIAQARKAEKVSNRATDVLIEATRKLRESSLRDIEAATLNRLRGINDH